MLALLRNWKYIVIVMLLVAIATLSYQNNKLQGTLDTKVAEIASLRAANSSLSSTIETLRESSKEQAIRLENMMGASRVLQEENNRLKSVLGGYKDREKTVVAKPKLIQRRANDAVSNLMLDYECATSADSDCRKGSN